MRLGDFRRGEELVLVDIMRALLDGDGGLSIEERKSFTWKWNTECCCDKCQRFGVNTHSGSIIQLMANALQQSCVDVTELFYHHFSGAPCEQWVCGVGGTCGGRVTKANKLLAVGEVLVMTIERRDGFLVTCKQSMQIGGFHYRLKGIGYHQASPDGPNHYFGVVERRGWWKVDGLGQRESDAKDRWALATWLEIKQDRLYPLDASDHPKIVVYECTTALSKLNKKCKMANTSWRA